MASLFGAIEVSFEAKVKIGDWPIEARVGAKVEMKADDQTTKAIASLSVKARVGDQPMEELTLPLLDIKEGLLEAEPFIDVGV